MNNQEQMTTRGEVSGSVSGMYMPLSNLLKRKPLTLPSETPVRQVLQAMEDNRVGSIIIADTDRPVGIFTLQDLLRRVVLRDYPQDKPVSGVMTPRPHTIAPTASALQAAQTMARHGLRRLLVVDEDQRLVGIVSQSDLFSLQRASSAKLADQIRHSTTIDALLLCVQEIRQTAINMLMQGLGADPLMHFLSTLNEQLSMRVIEITLEEFKLPEVRWCWLVLGSQGRLEQTFSTDQDNGIIFEAGQDDDVESIRQAFLPFAQEVNKRLDACGFPLCKGNVMAGNPEWCLSLGEWQRKFGSWIREAEPLALLNAAIFFDFRPLFGEEELVKSLRDWLHGYTMANPAFLRLMAANSLQTSPPLGLIRDFTYDNSKAFPHTIDLKLYGARPFVDGARIMSLAQGVPATTTAQRLRGVAEKVAFAEGDIEAMIDGFNFIQILRLRHQNELPPDAPGANRINPDELNELDRHILKQAFRQAKKLQARLQLDYRL